MHTASVSKRAAQALALGLLAAATPSASAQCDPAVLGSVANGPSARNVFVSGTTAFFVDGTQLVAADVSNPASPIILGSTGGLPGTNAMGLDVQGTTAYIAMQAASGPGSTVFGAVNVVDISNPASMSLLGSLTGINRLRDVSVSGNTAYAGSSDGGATLFYVIDVTNPATPTIIGTTNTADQTRNSEATGTTVYAANSFGLEVIDASVPTSPVSVSVINTGGSTFDIAIDGNLAYVVNTDGTLSIYDITAPLSPALLGSVSTTLVATNARVAVAGTTVFISDSTNGLWTIDASNSASPIVVANLGGVGTPTAVGASAAGDFAYVLSPDLALRVIGLGPCGGDLALSVADCQDDADVSAGYQIEVELNMLNLPASGATGFAAFLDYDLGVLAYRGDLSSYSGSPFSLHISPIAQGDDGLLELDGSVPFGGMASSADALLATLVFDVIADCDSMNPPNSTPILFETGGAFASKLSLDGVEVDTTLIDPSPYTLDDTAPVLDPCPANIFQAADADSAGGCGGAIVTFTDPGATDTCDMAPTVVCSPPSGSLFPLGVTTVTCTATDACGNESTCSFDVDVLATNEVDVTVELVGVHLPISRCILFQTTDSCAVSTSQTLSFIDHDGDDLNTNGIIDATEGTTNDPSTPVRAVDTITLPCGVYTGLCAKDEQHTKWSDSAAVLTAPGAHYVAGGVISLDGGDTDNDGDVDIDDVTWFLFQFGTTPAAAGGCPWDGVTRDADFSNNDAIGAEDYTFLTANWLTQSSCSCAMPDDRGGNGGNGRNSRTRAVAAQQRAVDFNRDGWVDADDVEIFEARNGLPHTLSQRMRDRQ